MIVRSSSQSHGKLPFRLGRSDLCRFSHCPEHGKTQRRERLSKIGAVDGDAHLAFPASTRFRVSSYQFLTGLIPMRISAATSKFHPSRYILLVLILGVIFSIIAVNIVNLKEYPNSDYFTFWLSGRLATLGQNPYDSSIWIAGHHQFGASWIPNATFVYPMPISTLFAPLGLIPLYQSFIVWDVLSQFMILASVVLLLSINPNLSTKPLILPITAGVILFRPTLVTLVNGQISGLLLLVIVCTLYLWEKGKWWQGSALLPILALKPNLGVPLIVFLSIYLLQQKQIRSLAVESISGLLLLVVGWIQNPNWVVDFWHAGNTKISQIFGFSPTVWGISAFFCDHNMNCTLGVGTCVGLLFLMGYFYLLTGRRVILSPASVVNLAVPIMLLLTPSCWPYDQLLLIVPIIWVITNLKDNGYGFLPVSFVFLAIDILALILLGASAMLQTEIFNAIIPLVVFGLLVWRISQDVSSSRGRYAASP